MTTLLEQFKTQNPGTEKYSDQEILSILPEVDSRFSGMSADEVATLATSQQASGLGDIVKSGYLNTMGSRDINTAAKELNQLNDPEFASVTNIKPDNSSFLGASADELRRRSLAGNGGEGLLEAEAQAQLDRGNERLREAGEVVLSGATQKFLSGSDENTNFLEDFLEDPVTIVAEIGAQSAYGSLEALGTGLLMAPGGIAGLSAGTGLGSGRVEFAHSVAEELRNSGIDTTNAKAMRQALADRPDLYRHATEKALVRAGIIGAADAATMGLASKTLGVGSGLVRQATNLASQSVVQMGGGATGEALAQVATEGKVTDGRAVAAEAVGELVTAPVDVYAATRSYMSEASAAVSKAKEDAAAAGGDALDQAVASGDAQSKVAPAAVAAEKEKKAASAQTNQYTEDFSGPHVPVQGETGFTGPDAPAQHFGPIQRDLSSSELLQRQQRIIAQQQSHGYGFMPSDEQKLKDSTRLRAARSEQNKAKQRFINESKPEGLALPDNSQVLPDVIYGEEPQYAAEEREQREADHFNAMYGQAGAARIAPVEGEVLPRGLVADESRMLENHQPPQGLLESSPMPQLPPGDNVIYGQQERPERSFTPTRSIHEGVGRNIAERQAPATAALPSKPAITQQQFIDLQQRYRKVVVIPLSKRTDEDKKAVQQFQAVKRGDIEVSDGSATAEVAPEATATQSAASFTKSDIEKLRADLRQLYEGEWGHDSRRYQAFSKRLESIEEGGGQHVEWAKEWLNDINSEAKGTANHRAGATEETQDKEGLKAKDEERQAFKRGEIPPNVTEKYAAWVKSLSGDRRAELFDSAKPEVRNAEYMAWAANHDAQGLPLNDGADSAPVFSRTSPNRSNDRSVLTVEAVEAAASTIASRLRLKRTPVVVRAAEGGLPAAILKHAAEQGAEGQIGAVLHEGSIYIVADKMPDATAVETAIWHESAHYGGRAVFGKEMVSAYRKLMLRMGGTKGLEAKVKEYGLSDLMKPYFETAETLPADYKAAFLIDEFLAHSNQLQADEKLPARIMRAVKEFIGAVRDMLRKRGYKELPELSDSDIAYVLKQINKAAREGESKADKPHFMRVSEEDKMNFFFEDLASQFEAPAMQRSADAPMFSRVVTADEVGEQTGDREYTADQLAAIKKGGFGKKPKMETYKERFADIRKNFMTKVRQGMVDQYASFKDILGDNRAWMMANLSSSSTGALESAIQHGRPFMKDNAVSVDTKQSSLQELLEPLGKELDDWLMWMAGNRAEMLKAEDRENLFNDTDIAALKSLSGGKMPDGGDRNTVYQSVRKEFEALNNSITDIAVETGLVSKAEAKLWAEQGFYIPFYRALEEDGTSRGPRAMTKGGLIHQTAYKKLTGGTAQLDDLMTNVLMNWNHLLGASLKNQAASKAISSAEKMGLATPVPKSAKSKDAVYVRENGREKWYEVADGQDGALVLDSLLALNWDGLNTRPMKAMRWFKRALTVGVTASPEFKLANLMRDSITAVAVADMSTQIHKNLYQGWKATGKDKDTAALMIAGGGAFGDSGYIHGADPDAIKHLVKKGVKRDSIVDPRTALKKLWDGYQDFGSRLENINRAANFEHSLEEGKDLLEANFEARDHLDFSRTGSWIAVRAIAQTVPFLNARLQGLDKLGRAAMSKNQRAQFMAVVGTYTAASVLLYLAMKDDEDYQDAEQWERDAYHLIKVPGTEGFIRIPRPFEVGAVGAMAERLAEQMIDDEVNGGLFAERLGHTLLETFSFDPTPQMFKPMMEVYANKDSFTGRSIESISMQRLSPERRKRGNTSEMAAATSAAMSDALPSEAVLSPVQIEHLVRGYFGWAGATSLAIMDNLIARPLSDAPAKPSRRVTEYPLLKRFSRSGTPYSTKYTEVFYNRLQQISEANADVRDARKLKDFKEARELFKESRNKLRYRKFVSRVNKEAGELRKRIGVIRLSPRLTPDQKRELIDRLQSRINKLMKLAVRRTEKAFD
mgnify:CR=1 FL=1